MKQKLPGLLTATLVLVGASAVGCGGGGAPSDATEKEFCDSLNSLFEDVDLSAEPSEKEAVAAIKDWGKGLEEVGTPEKISDDAREGFDLMIKQVSEISAQDDFAKLDDALSDSEKKASAAFEDYAETTCGDIGIEEPELPEVPAPSS